MRKPEAALRLVVLSFAKKTLRWGIKVEEEGKKCFHSHKGRLGHNRWSRWKLVICYTQGGKRKTCTHTEYFYLSTKTVEKCQHSHDVLRNNSKRPERPHYFPLPPQIKWDYVLTQILTGKCHIGVPLEQRWWCWKTVEHLPMVRLSKTVNTLTFKKLMDSVSLEY